MREKYKNMLMWALYAALFLLIMVVQTVAFGRVRYFGSKLSLLPVALACIAMENGPEKGGLFGLIAGTVWCLSGADGAGLWIVLMAGCGVVVGYWCDTYLVRNLFTSALMCLFALVVTEGILFAFKYFIGQADAAMLSQLAVQIGLSMAACPPMFLAAWAIRKAGA